MVKIQSIKKQQMHRAMDCVAISLKATGPVLLVLVCLLAFAQNK